MELVCIEEFMSWCLTMVDVDGGRFVDVTEVHDRQSFLEFLLKNDFVALNTKDKDYILMPIEIAYVGLQAHYYYQ